MLSESARASLSKKMKNDAKSFDVEIPALEGYEFCFKKEGDKQEGDFDFESCDICSRICQDNIDVTTLSSSLTCDGVTIGGSDEEGGDEDDTKGNDMAKNKIKS